MSNGHATLEVTATSTQGDAAQPPEQHPMALLLEQIEQSLLEPAAGEIRTGVIVEKRSHEILVDIGYKSEGIVNGREIERISDIIDTLNVGDEVPVYVLREDKDGRTLLTYEHADGEACVVAELTCPAVAEVASVLWPSTEPE